MLIDRNLICVAILFALMGCSSSSTKSKVVDENNRPEPEIKSIEAQMPIASPKQTSTNLVMTYQNHASTLSIALDPYDENLQITMSRSPVQIKAEDLDGNGRATSRRPEEKPQPIRSEKRDTVFVVKPPEAPVFMGEYSSSNFNQNVSSSSGGDLVWADVTDEVLSDIRKAQGLFYEKEYDNALKIVNQAQSKRRTAEGHALAGSIFYMQGDREGARRQWLEALDLNPDMPEVQRMLKKVEGGL